MDEKREYEDRMNPGVQPEYVVQKQLRLTDLLFALRKRLAAKKKLPAYLIFSDATLREIGEKKPVSRDEFLAVKGVGEAKADRYGKAVTELVRQFVEAEG